MEQVKHIFIEGDTRPFIVNQGFIVPDGVCEDKGYDIINPFWQLLLYNGRKQFHPKDWVWKDIRAYRESETPTPLSRSKALRIARKALAVSHSLEAINQSGSSNNSKKMEGPRGSKKGSPAHRAAEAYNYLLTLEVGDE